VKLAQLIKVTNGSYQLIEFDSRVGLNASQTLCTFQCLFDETSKTFYVYLGNATIDKFTKSTFLNLVTIAEKVSATKVVIVQTREHS